MKTHRYQSLADQLEHQIQSGHYQPHDRLPSLRQVSRREGVSIGTLVQAYGLLESRGLVYARPQSGFFVSPRVGAQLQHLNTSHPQSAPKSVSIGALSLEIVRATSQPELTPLGPAYPALCFAGCRAFNAQLARAARNSKDHFGHYEVPPGHLELRRQLALRALDAGCNLDADELMITNGCQEALTLALQAVAKAGEVIAVESPLFYGTLQAIEVLGLKVVEVPTHPLTGIDLAALEEVLERWPVRACLLSPTLSNPMGSVMPDVNKQRLLNMLRLYDLPLIEDDVFGDLHFASRRPQAIKAWDTEGRVIWCSSVSKTLDPSIRLGWVAGGRYQARLEYIKFVSTMASPTLPQAALAAHLARGGFDRHLRQIRSYYRTRRDMMIGEIEHHFPERTRLSVPAGGFLLWVELPPGYDAMHLYRHALCAGISIAPGPLFSAQGRYTRFIRLNYALEDQQQTAAAIRQLAALARKSGGRNDDKTE